MARAMALPIQPYLNLPQPQIDFQNDPTRAAVQMRAVYKVPMAASQVYDILTDPDEFTRVFKRNFRGYSNLKVREDNEGVRLKEIEMEQWYNVLVWRGTLRTHMHFEEDSSQLTIDFRLGRQTMMMKNLEGKWELTPLPEEQKGVPMTQVALYETIKVKIPGVPSRAFPLRRFTRKVTEDMVADLREEAVSKISKAGGSSKVA